MMHIQKERNKSCTSDKHFVDFSSFEIHNDPTSIEILQKYSIITRRHFKIFETLQKNVAKILQTS